MRPASAHELAGALECIGDLTLAEGKNREPPQTETENLASLMYVLSHYAKTLEQDSE